MIIIKISIVGNATAAQSWLVGNVHVERDVVSLRRDPPARQRSIIPEPQAFEQRGYAMQTGDATVAQDIYVPGIAGYAKGLWMSVFQTTSISLLAIILCARWNCAGASAFPFGAIRGLRVLRTRSPTAPNVGAFTLWNRRGGVGTASIG